MYLIAPAPESYAQQNLHGSRQDELQTLKVLKVGWESLWWPPVYLARDFPLELTMRQSKSWQGQLHCEITGGYTFIVK